MIYYRCKCGSLESSAMRAPPRCRVCSDCGSTMSASPDRHPEPIEHEYVLRYDESSGKPYQKCRRCHRDKVDV